MGGGHAQPPRGRLAHVLRQHEARLAGAGPDGGGDGLDPAHAAAVGAALGRLRATQLYVRVELVLQVFLSRSLAPPVAAFTSQSYSQSRLSALSGAGPARFRSARCHGAAPDPRAPAPPPTRAILSHRRAAGSLRRAPYRPWRPLSHLRLLWRAVLRHSSRPSPRSPPLSASLSLTGSILPPPLHGRGPRGLPQAARPAVRPGPRRDCQ